MIPSPPPGQGPIDPRQAFSPPAGGQSPGAGWQQQSSMQLPPPPGAPSTGPGGFGPSPMPPGMMPPGMYAPFPPPRPPRRSVMGWVVVTGILLVLLFVSVLFNLFHLGSAFSGSDRGNQATLVTGDASQTIAVVPIQGVIDDRLAAKFDRLMGRVEADTDVKAIVLRIDTPGGSVTASDEIYDRILKFKKKRGNDVPVVVSMGGLATSGGYYASCAGDHVFAEHTTLTANIGVLMPSINFSDLMKKYGVQDTTVVSTGAIFKEAGSPTIAPTPEHMAYLQGIADSAFKRFKDVVKTGRGATLKGDIEKIADGRVLVADEAAKVGLVDEIGYLDDAWQYAAKTAKLGSPTVVKYEENVSLLDLLTGRSPASSPAASSRNVTVNGINVNVDSHLLDELSTPRLMYLWRGQ